MISVITLPVSATAGGKVTDERDHAWLPATAAPSQSSLATNAVNSPLAIRDRITRPSCDIYSYIINTIGRPASNPTVSRTNV